MPEAVKAERLAMLQTLLNEQQAAFNRASEGHTMAVLLERTGRRAGQLVGRSPYMQAVHLAAPPWLLGKIVEVRIDAGHPNSLAGSFVGGRSDPPEVRRPAANSCDSLSDAAI